MTDDGRYNGWTNHATWACNLWLGDAAGEWATETADALVADLSDHDVPDDDQRADLTDAVTDTVKRMLDDCISDDLESLRGDQNNLFTDLLGTAVRAIDTREIARTHAEDAVDWALKQREE